MTAAGRWRPPGRDRGRGTGAGTGTVSASAASWRWRPTSGGLLEVSREGCRQLQLHRSGLLKDSSKHTGKGYRYELWCLARGAGIRYCVLFCDVEENICRQWNKERGEQEVSTYDEKIFADLAQRFERPVRRNRWDSPLFELMPSRDRIEDSSPAIVEAVSYLTRKIDSKSRDVKVLQPTIATQHARVTEANSLYEMDQATQEVINVIVETQAQGLMANRISFGQHLPTINVQRTVGLPELRSLRRTFMKLTGQASLSGPPPPSDADSAKRMFIEYLNRELTA